MAAALVYFGFRLNWLESRLLDSVLTMVWVVGLTNAFNLLDNMDGLCAGIALIVAAMLLAGFWTGVSRENATPEMTLLADARRRRRRVSGLQLSARIDLHGRFREHCCSVSAWPR